MKTLKFLMIAFFSLLIVFSGCKKDEENGDPENAPEYTVKTVDVPPAMQNSNDPGAQTAASYIGIANSYAGMGAMMVPPEKSTLVTNLKDGTPWTYSWTIDDGEESFTVTMTVTEDAQKYIWEFSITGMLDGVSVNNFVYMRGTEYKDGSQGSLEMWDPQNFEQMFSWTWSENDGTTTMEMLFFGEFKIVLVSYPDGSGSLEFYEWVNGEFVLEFKVVWTAAGTGEWWEYDNGVITEHGSWP